MEAPIEPSHLSQNRVGTLQGWNSHALSTITSMKPWPVLPSSHCARRIDGRKSRGERCVGLVLKAKDVCIGPKCIFYKKVPEVLICVGCKEVAETKDWAPLNILYCRKGEHKQLRAPIPDIKKVWEKYLGKFTHKTPEQDIRISVNKIFAGPHKTFTNTNRGVRTHAVYSLGMNNGDELSEAEGDDAEAEV